ncbi:MAG: glycosyltransferase [Granulosicoccus sp.]
MKITFYVSAFPILSETFILSQVTGLIDRGHDIQIVAQRIENQSVTHPDVLKYKLMARTTCCGDAYANMPKNKLARAIQAFGLFFRAGVVPRSLLMRTLNVARYGKDALTLNLFYRVFYEYRERPDTEVAFCHFGHNGESFARVIDVGGSSAKLVTVFHGQDLSRDLQLKHESLYAFLFKRGHLFLPVSGHWMQTLLDMGCPKDKTSVHHMGVEPSYYAAPEPAPTALQHKNTETTLLTVARFVEKKGLTYAIDGFSQIAEEFQSVRYCIIGDGPLSEALQQQINNLNLQERITLVPPKNRIEIRQALADSHIFLLPSVTASDGDMEGIPVVLMEAMASGLPVISTRHSGIPELVDSEKTGFLHEERDAQGIADSLRRLLTDQQLSDTIGKAAQEKIVSDYNLDVLNINLEKHFSSVLTDAD